MLAFGFEKEWSRIVIRTAVLNLVLMGLLLLVLKPAVGIAVMGVILDIYSVFATYLFYRRTTRLTSARADADPLDQAVFGLKNLRASGADLP